MSRLYPLSLVGESHYQETILTCFLGERVYICHEHGNPFDDLALKVETAGGQTIGYVPKSSWLRNAIHEEGRGVISTIASIASSAGGPFGVVLEVSLSDDTVGDREYIRPCA